jgi:hypothetical protein
MKKSKFADIVRTFTKDEVKEFGKFLESPFFNSNKNLSAAFEYINFHTSGFVSEFPTKEEIHDSVYKGKKYKDENVRYILSELLRMGEEYLGIVNLRKSSAIRIHTLAELNDRDLEKLFERNLKLCRKAQKMPPDVFEHYRVFINAVRDLVELKTLYDRDLEDKIMVRLESMRPGKERHWISEKAGMLSQKKS